MKRKTLNIDELQSQFQVISGDFLSTIPGGITFANWYELVKYISENGVTSDIANTHWDMNGSGGLNRIDIVPHNGQWGFWATTGNASGPDLANGIPGSISVNVNSTWVPVQSANVNNGARAYLEAMNSMYKLGNGYVMGYKTSSDLTYENFWKHVSNTLTGGIITLGATMATAGVAAAANSILGSFFGGLAVDYGLGKIPDGSVAISSAADKERNNIILAALQSGFLAEYTAGTTMGGTLRFNTVEISPMALTIDMKDLMDALSNHMENNNVATDSGDLIGNRIDGYREEVKALLDGSTSMIELIHRLGGTSTRTDSAGGGAGGGLGGGGGVLSPTGPGYTEPLPDGTYYPVEGFDQPEFFFYHQMPTPENGPEVSSEPIQNVIPSGGYIENGVWTDDNGDRWLLLYCDQVPQPQDTTGYGLSWSATKLKS